MADEDNEEVHLVTCFSRNMHTFDTVAPCEGGGEVGGDPGKLLEARRGWNEAKLPQGHDCLNLIKSKRKEPVRAEWPKMNEKANSTPSIVMAVLLSLASLYTSLKKRLWKQALCDLIDTSPRSLTLPARLLLFSQTALQVADAMWTVEQNREQCFCGRM